VPTRYGGHEVIYSILEWRDDDTKGDKVNIALVAATLATCWPVQVVLGQSGQGAQQGQSAVMTTSLGTIAVGEPYYLEVTLTNGAQGDWAVNVLEGDWQRWDAGSGEWRSGEIKRDRQSHEGQEVVVRMGEQVTVELRQDAGVWGSVGAGRWRTRATWWSRGERAVRQTDWVEISVMPHERNRRIIEGEFGQQAQAAWVHALTGEGLVDVPAAVATALGAVPSQAQSSRESLREALMSLRALGASDRLAARADLTVAKSSMWRLGRIPREQWATHLPDIVQKLQQLEQQCGNEQGRKGGLKGEIMEAYIVCARVESPQAAATMVQQLQGFPARAAGIEARADAVRERLRTQALLSQRESGH